MKITTILASRGRPLNLITAVMSLYRLRSCLNEVDFIVGVDDDDRPTIDAVERMRAEAGIPVRANVARPTPVMGDTVQRITHEADPEAIVLQWADRMLPLSRAWDEIIAQGIAAHPSRALWIQSHFYDGAANWVLGPAGRRAIPDLTSHLFPYWFDDNWLEEIDLLAHGFPRLRLDVWYGGERFGKTHNFRDYPFWVEVFAATRFQRIEMAHRACERLGLVFRQRPEVCAYLEQRDALWRSKAPEIEATNRTDAAPTEAYRLAKQRAEMLISNKERAA